MQIFYPKQYDECDDDDNTSFTFDDKEEEQNFCSWLNDLNLSFVKTRVPSIVEGKKVLQTCVIVNQPVDATGADSDDEEDGDNASAVEEVEEKPKKGRRSKKKETPAEEEEE